LRRPILGESAFLEHMCEERTEDARGVSGLALGSRSVPSGHGIVTEGRLRWTSTDVGGRLAGAAVGSVGGEAGSGGGLSVGGRKMVGGRVSSRRGSFCLLK